MTYSLNERCVSACVCRRVPRVVGLSNCPARICSLRHDRPFGRQCRSRTLCPSHYAGTSCWVAINDPWAYDSRPDRADPGLADITKEKPHVNGQSEKSG